jgi:hypothetical protein
MAHSPTDGWPWPTAQANGSTSAQPMPTPDLARAFARCFGSPDGQAVLLHLGDITLRRALGPDAGDAQLRHLEGQRQLVVYVQALIARGRAGH